MLSALRMNEHDPVGAIKLVDGVIHGNAHPRHHPDCLIQTTSSIVAKEFDRQAQREVAEGYSTPRQAWFRVSRACSCEVCMSLELRRFYAVK